MQPERYDWGFVICVRCMWPMCIPYRTLPTSGSRRIILSLSPPSLYFLSPVHVAGRDILPCLGPSVDALLIFFVISRAHHVSKYFALVYKFYFVVGEVVLL